MNDPANLKEIWEDKRNKGAGDDISVVNAYDEMKPFIKSGCAK